MDASRPLQPPAADPEPIDADAAPPAPPPVATGPAGRTRPVFEELAPGPPTWPGWVAAPVGFLFAIAGDAVADFLISQQGASVSSAVGLWVGFIGALVLVGGLGWIALASIIRRRVLPPNRYRGPSIFVLFAMLELGLPLVLLPPLLALTGGDVTSLTSPAALTVQLALTPITFGVLLLVFVALPRALQGVRLWQGRASVRLLVIGLVVGLFVWTAAQVLAGVAVAILRGLGINPGGEQEVTAIAQQLPVPIAVLTIAVLAPIAEELFFRGFVFNAWEREYGTRSALIGAVLLFAAAHVPGGTPLAVVIVLLLGLVLTAVYARTRNLATTIGIHSAFNLASVLALFLFAGR